MKLKTGNQQRSMKPKLVLWKKIKKKRKKTQITNIRNEGGVTFIDRVDIERIVEEYYE